MTVFKRWAIVNTDAFSNSLRIVACIKLSVSKSTAAVASSNTRILVFRNKALARQTNCLCPTLLKQINIFYFLHIKVLHYKCYNNI